MSLRTRLLLAVLACVAAGLLVAGGATYLSLRNFMLERVDAQLAHARAHGGRADHDRERHQRPPRPQLADALHERRLELREAAAHKHPTLLSGPCSHTGGERITGS